MRTPRRLLPLARLLTLLSIVSAAASLGCQQGGNQPNPQATLTDAAIPQTQAQGARGEAAVMPHGVEAEDLPVTKVSLYQNGVGYFERTGTVDGDVVSLRIRPDQINDILKSLTVVDLDQKGKALSISLPADRETVNRLDDLPPQIREQGGLLELLRAFRGARVSLNVEERANDKQPASKRTVQGRIVGVESIATYGPNGNDPNWRVMLRKDDESLEIVALATITGMKIQDRTLEVGLEKSLDMSLNDGSWKPIELKVRLDSKAKRRVQVSYIVAMPVWKPAYRLRLGDDKALFQGWAVVDNVSGADWKDVMMSLVAGNPTSFQYNLYTPQFVARPDLSHLARKVAYAPSVIESAREGSRQTASLKRKEESYPSAPPPPPPPSAAPMGRGAGSGAGRYDNYEGDFSVSAEAAPVELALDDYRVSDTPSSTGQQISALFEYKLEKPVSIPDRASSLVNIVEQTIDAKEIVLFNPAFGTSYTALNPHRAVQMTNNTGFALEPGPITLYRGSTFIGEGLLSTVAKEQVAFITFALDPQVLLKTSELQTERGSAIVKIAKGVLETEMMQVNTVTYELRNDSPEDVEAVIRRQERAGWKVDPLPDDIKLAAGVYFVTAKVPAGQTVKVTLRETTPIRRNLSIDSTQTLELLKVSVGAADLPDDVKAQLQKVVDTRGKLNDIQLELQTLRTQKAELEAELSAKTRSLNELENIKDPGAVELRKRLLTTASELQAQVNQRTTRIITLDQERLDQDRLMRSLFQTISFEAPKK
jgi:hypothetical protein